jgi:hypothetical protein
VPKHFSRLKTKSEHKETKLKARSEKNMKEAITGSQIDLPRQSRIMSQACENVTCERWIARHPK